MSIDIKNRWIYGRLETVGKCPVCKESLDLAEHYSRRDDSLSFPDVWHLHHCKICQSICLNPRPDDISLPLAYMNYYTHSESQDAILNGDGFIRQLVLGYLHKRFNFKSKAVSKIGYVLFSLILPLKMKLDVYGRHIPRSMCNEKTNLLDLGCGNGDFLLRAQAMGLNAIGIEPDPNAVAAMKRLGLNVIQGDLSSVKFENGTFDYITLNHVIEHVKDPKQLLVDIFKITAPGGIVWLGLPNPQAYGLSIFKRAWKGLHPPFHLIIPSQTILKEWLIEAGFENIEFKRRGLESKGLWREQIMLAEREKVGPNRFVSQLLKLLVSFISIVSHKKSEETIVIAQKTGAKHGG